MGIGKIETCAFVWEAHNVSLDAIKECRGEKVLRNRHRANEINIWMNKQFNRKSTEI